MQMALDRMVSFWAKQLSMFKSDLFTHSLGFHEMELQAKHRSYPGYVFTARLGLLPAQRRVCRESDLL